MIKLDKMKKIKNSNIFNKFRFFPFGKRKHACIPIYPYSFHITIKLRSILQDSNGQKDGRSENSFSSSDNVFSTKNHSKSNKTIYKISATKTSENILSSQRISFSKNFVILMRRRMNMTHNIYTKEKERKKKYAKPLQTEK